MPDKAFFTPEIYQFLRQLKRHNDRDWFANNKDRYQRIVVEPALRFISEFASRLEKISPHFVADPRPSRGSLFRIYRDTRFSPDKSPYKTHVGIHFLHEKGKDVHAPLFYLHLEPEGCFVAAGVWHPDTLTLTRIRSAIIQQPGEWSRIRRKLELGGESLSKPPRGYDPKHPHIEDLKKKDYVTSVVLTEEQVCSPKFMREFAAACQSISPLAKFTTNALGLEF